MGGTGLEGDKTRLAVANPAMPERDGHIDLVLAESVVMLWSLCV
jgi:hypothetical protein